jgi:Icc protein
MHYLPGNHDVIEPFIDQLCQRDPTQPFDYEFEQKGVQVVCLDSNGQLPSHAGWLNESQLARLDVICEADDTRPLVVALHHHPVAVDVNWLDDLMLLNGQDFHRILLQARHRLRGVFFGHIHHSIDVMVDGILYSSAASGYYQFRGWPGHPTPALEVGASPGFNVVTITPHQTFVRHYHIGVENFT